MQQFASKKIKLTFDSSLTQTLENGNSVYVYGFVVSNTTFGTVVLSFTDINSNTLFKYSITAFSNKKIFIPFLAGNGLSITSDTLNSGVSVTVFHTHPGS